MFKFCSLYSGSTGNSLFVETKNTKLLIDSGESAKKISDALSQLDVDVHDIDGILVTHEHSDHIKGLGTLSKKFNIPVYANQETWNAMPEQKEKVAIENQKLYQPFEEFEIGDLKISPFQIPHDAANPCGFSVYYQKNKISIATDLGHIDDTIMEHLENSSFIMLEANYDPQILKCSSYPYSLKRRIAGPNGHLSNTNAGEIISSLIPSGLRSVMLGHLSKENNFPELAYKTVIEELMQHHYDENGIKVSVASRLCASPLIDLV